MIDQEMSPSIGNLAKALALAQGAIRGATKDSKNPHYGSDYADLASVWEACRAALAGNGLAVVQTPSTNGKTVSVTTYLLHLSGEWMRGICAADARDGGPQAVGSVITYLRRYSLAAMVGVAPADDDAEAGEGRTAHVVVTPAPEGFDEWWTDLQAVADEGLNALKAAWTQSPPAYRRHLTTTNAKAWDALKAHAATVGGADAA